ncbi:transglycosylase SLT domain-containing protein [Novosphingopyxis sp.]|uniref:transglycosylase SLT domain-containing protein n=1 Tax=Novosphingopyxis sp. TaxID=2709690 RepID=UPI003B5AB9EB
MLESCDEVTFRQRFRFATASATAGMSALSLTLVAQFALSCPAASAIPTGRIVELVVTATAQTESGFEPTAIHDNTSGRSYAAPTPTEAVALVAALHAQGHRLDAGVMQVNDANWARLGLTAERVFDPRANVCAGVAVLAEAYTIERRVSCRYNTGHPECANGYPERVEGALRRVRAEMAAGPAIPAEMPQPAAKPLPPPDPFVGHTRARELTFAPLFLFAAQPLDGPRPAAPAVPVSRLATASRNPGELVSMRSSNQ